MRADTRTTPHAVLCLKCHDMRNEENAMSATTFTIIEWALFLLLGVTPIALRSLRIGVTPAGRMSRAGFAISAVPALLIVAFYALR